MTYFDSDLRSCDWTKKTWDIWLGTTLVKTADQLLEFLHVASQSVEIQRAAVSEFGRLPVGMNMPSPLRRELEARRLLSYTLPHG